MTEYGRDNGQYARDTIGWAQPRCLLIPFILSISTHRPDHDHLDFAFRSHKPRHFSLLPWHFGRTAFATPLDVIYGTWHYSDGGNESSWWLISAGEGSVKGDDNYEGSFCFPNGTWLWRVSRVRRLYFLSSFPCCPSAWEVKHWEALAGFCSFQPNTHSWESHCLRILTPLSCNPGPLTLVDSWVVESYRRRLF